MLDGPSAGEAGGIFAGIVALLIALGHGIRWLAGYEDRRARTRTEKLDVWQQELADREKRLDDQIAAYQERIAGELDALRREHAALWRGYQMIAGALRAIDPDNDALRLGDELLRSAFPVDPLVPGDMQARLTGIDDKRRTDR